MFSWCVARRRGKIQKYVQGTTPNTIQGKLHYATHLFLYKCTFLGVDGPNETDVDWKSTSIKNCTNIQCIAKQCQIYKKKTFTNA